LSRGVKSGLFVRGEEAATYALGACPDYRDGRM
jgi:hypothetical protein